MSQKSLARCARLLPGGIPHYVRCYDNGGATVDRYTVVYTGHYPGRDGLCHYVGMSSEPYSPQGFCQHGESRHVIDRPTYRHLGKRIGFADLPADCRRVVVVDYLSLWKLSGLDIAALLDNVCPPGSATLAQPFLFYEAGTSRYLVVERLAQYR